MCFNFLQFIRREPAGIDNDAVHFIAFVFTEIFYTVGGIQSAAESQNNFFTSPGFVRVDILCWLSF